MNLKSTRRAPWLGTLVGFLLALAPISVFADPTFVKPGDTGSIELVVEIDQPSVAAAKDVSINIVAPPHFVVKATSIRGPLDIAPGASATFVVDYEIAADAPEGSFDAVLKITMGTAGVEPDPEAAASDTSVIYARQADPSLVDTAA